MEEIEFPKSLERIGKEAFLNCVNLKSAKVQGNVDIDVTAFEGCRQLAV